MIKIEDVLQPVSDTLPCGNDLYDSGELFELENLAALRAATNDEGKRIAKEQDNARDPDWSKLASRCEELLRKSRDLRAVGFYTAAELRLSGIPGLANGTAIMSGMLEKWGVAVHPVVDPKSSDSVRERLGAIVGISAPYKRDGDLFRVIEGLRKIPLAPAPGGAVDYAAVLAARKPDGSDDAVMVGNVRDHWAKADAAKKAEMFGAIRATIKNLERIETWISSQLPPEFVPSDAAMSSVTLLANELKALLRVMDGVNGSDPVQETPEANQDQPMNENPTESTQVAPRPTGPISSRDDAIRMLGQVRDYFQRTEPTCPANFFIERAMKLVGKNFLEALNELMPETAAKFQQLTGLSPDDEKKSGK